MKNLILSITVLIFPICGIAQENKPNFNLTASIQPLFAINNALRLDVEINPAKKFPTLIISPEIYSGYSEDKGSYLEIKDEISGLGIGISHKVNFKVSRLRPYLTYGFMYRNIAVKYSDEGFIPVFREGLEYYEFGYLSDKLRINSFLVNSCAGFEITKFDRIVIDFYGGIGLKNSSRKSNFPEKRLYSQEQYSLAYSGFLPMAGVKIGYKIIN